LVGALLAGTDFFTAEVLTLRGLVTYYVLFFIHLESRRVDIAAASLPPPAVLRLGMSRTADSMTVRGDDRPIRRSP
jgi:putative transposase